MAKVSLRIYDREIEGLIDQGNLDEAIAHCRHILQTFSKHLETYRLLGKAYLEAKRYDEAVDVFSRVLMAVPDDFVSHVGMSIIRDDQRKMDDAIWHMERAFEAQPSNAAIQSELQRLFGRRDGVEPHKIRMTRGALAHMYVQGELFPQAIGEIKAVLAQDDQREDMRSLLARAYFHSGQKADASDVCAQLLQHYPYSFDANRIMVELLQGSDSVENTTVYRHRTNELDPYAAFVQGSVFHSNEVSDAAVNLERLEYHGEEVETGAAWNAANMGLGPGGKDHEPDWLKAGLEAETPMEPAAAAKPGDIPDFLREAGWTESSGAAEEPVSFQADDQALGEADLAPADMPDWLKAMAPTEGEAESEPPASTASNAEAEDWLDSLRAATPSVEGESGIPDWLTNMESGEKEPTPPPAAPALPDWLQPMDSEPAAATPELPIEEPSSILPEAESTLPDWLETLPAEPNPAAAEAPAEELPSMLSESASSLPDWLESLPPESTSPVGEVPAEEPSGILPEAEFSLPDWLQPASSEPSDASNMIIPEPDLTPLEPSASEPPSAASVESPLIPDFLPEEAPMIIPEMDLPPAAPAVPPISAPTPAASLDSLGTSAQEQDDAMAWLESLAAKHGAKAEELVTDPNARSEKPPDWVEQARALGEAQASAPEPNFLEPLQESQPEPETPRAGEPPQPFEFQPLPEMPAEPPPAAEPELPLGTEPLLESEPEPLEPSADETGIWLRELSQKEETPQDLPENLFEAESTPAVSQAPDLDVADWLSKLDAAAPTPEPPSMEKEEASAEASDLPDWLRGLDSEEKWPASASLGDELPAWLQAEPEPPAQPEPTAPTDWHPAEAEPEPPALSQSHSEFDMPVETRHLPELEAEPETPAAVEPERPHYAEFEPPAALEAELEPEEEAPVPEPEVEAPWQPEPETRFETAAESETQFESPAQPEPEAEPRFEPETQFEAPSQPEPEPMRPEVPEQAPASEEIVSEPEPEQPAAVPAPRTPAGRPQAPRRHANVLPPVGEPALESAHAEMSRGNIPAALENYGRLIRRGKQLEEIIRDLRDALYRYPVEVTIWQTLGDAYMRNNRLQEALDAYTKAEELLR